MYSKYTYYISCAILGLLLAEAARAELPEWFLNKTVGWAIDNVGRDRTVNGERFLCWYQDENNNGYIEGYAGTKYPSDITVGRIGLLTGADWNYPADDGTCLDSYSCHPAKVWEPEPVTLRWDAPPDEDLAYYTVYEDGFPTYEVTETAVQVERIPGACYMVTAVDTSGNESLPSNEACEGAT